MKAKRLTRDQFDEITAKLSTTSDNAVAELALAVKARTEIGATLGDEIKITENRKVALEKVLGNDEDLAAYIGSFDVAMGSPTKVQVGDAPPCRQYADLITIEALTEISKGLDTAQTKEDMEAVKKDLTAKRKPLLALLASVNSAISDLSRARKAAETAHKKKKEERSVGAAAEPSTKRLRVESGDVLFDKGMELASQFAQIATVGELAAMKLDGPHWLVPTLVAKCAVEAHVDKALAHDDRALEKEVDAGERALKDHIKKGQVLAKADIMPTRAVDANGDGPLFSQDGEVESVCDGCSVETIAVSSRLVVRTVTSRPQSPRRGLKLVVLAAGLGLTVFTNCLDLTVLTDETVALLLHRTNGRMGRVVLRLPPCCAVHSRCKGSCTRRPLSC